jgi:hypothetical protein
MYTALKKRAALLACVPLAVVLAPAAAAAAPAETPLTPELATLALPAVAAAPEARQDEALQLPSEGPGSLVREGEDVVVEAHFEGGAVAAEAELEAAGATVLEASGRYQTVALSVAPEDLEALAEVPRLEAVEPALAPVFYGAEEAAAEEAGGSGPTTAAAGASCEGGSVISQALSQLRVAAARGVFGVSGAGLTIGVISDSYDKATEAATGGAIATHAYEDEVSNDLPGPAGSCEGQQLPVNVIADGPSGTTDEGRAMLQVIHDLAPAAQLAFATAYSTEIQFAKNIERLAAPVTAGGAGADVIVDDVGYYAEPYFQDGPVAVAIRNVTAAGVTYLTAAGNNNLISGGRDFASWERSGFVDAACPAAVATAVGGGEAAASCMNFSPTGTDTAFGIAVNKGASLNVDLQWAEPWYGVESDLDAYLLNAGGEIVAEATSLNGPGGVNKPYELLQWKNSTGSAAQVNLVIDRCIGTCNPAASVAAKPRLKFALLQNGGGVSTTEYPESNPAAGITVGPTIYGHSGAAAAITLGAVNFQQSASAPVEPERYSSRGPVAHYFGPVAGTTRAAALPAPEAVQKPNVTATDCASTTFFATFNGTDWNFCGTSEAAPHAAAVAALMLQARPAASPGQVLAALESSATAFTGAGVGGTAVGAGLVNAEAAIPRIQEVAPPLEAAPTSPQGTTTPATAPSGTTPAPAPESGGESSSGSSGTQARPRARIAAHPRKVVRTRRARVVGRFRFAADTKGVTFLCRVDRTAKRRCGAHFRRRFDVGSHVVRVRAVDKATGSVSRWVTFRFRVKRVGR